jgi:hypothetical protein
MTNASQLKHPKPPGRDACAQEAVFSTPWRLYIKNIYDSTPPGQGLAENKHLEIFNAVKGYLA